MSVIRPATAADLPAIRALVERAYALYVPRIGRRPAPMDADYAAHVAAGEAAVFEQDGTIAGLVIWRPEADHGFIDNVAVDPARQGHGIGRLLIAWVEGEAARRGLPELRLYTNARMIENLAMYPKLGWIEFERRKEGGFDRVYFRKRI
jgi:GNAT superfamily N-acetyltransferase